MDIPNVKNKNHINSFWYLEETMKKLKSMPMPQQLICLGSGSPVESRIAQYQIAMCILLTEIFKVTNYLNGKKLVNFMVFKC